LQGEHHAFEGFLLAAHFLGLFRVVPDRRIFEFGVQLFQLL
jgi:hypothetical protein